MEDIVKRSHHYFIGNDSQFKSWLAEYDFDLYSGFVAETKGSGKRVTSAMEALLPSLDRLKLLEFVLKTYQNAVSDRIMNHINSIVNMINSNQDTITVPSRRVFTGDCSSELKELYALHEICHHATIGNITVVEWIPNQFKHLVDRVPSCAWLHKSLSPDVLISL